MTERVGFIGLGAMGLPMARRLLAAGYELAVVPHTNMGPAQQLVDEGATVVTSPGDLVERCAVVITSLPDVPQVREVLFDGGLASSRSTGLLHIDMSTITPSAAKEFHQKVAGFGMDSLDAPVSGGPVRAADGTLTIMVGGHEATFERALPILRALGKNIIHVGEGGTGQAVKLVNQFMISVIMLANVEALSLGVKAGIPLETLTEVISTSSGSNYIMQQWLPKTLFSGDLSGGFALDLLLKDLSAALGWASDIGSPALMGGLAQQMYRLAQSQGSGRQDYSAVARFYEEASGAVLRGASPEQE